MDHYPRPHRRPARLVRQLCLACCASLWLVSCGDPESTVSFQVSGGPGLELGCCYHSPPIPACRAPELEINCEAGEVFVPVSGVGLFCWTPADYYECAACVEMYGGGLPANLICVGQGLCLYDTYFQCQEVTNDPPRL